MDYVIKRIDASRSEDINIKNEPFKLTGKMTPFYNGKWSYKITELPKSEIRDMTFPDENYDYDAMYKDFFFIGAYEKTGECIAVMLLQKPMFKYLYLYDMKVNSLYRRKGVGRSLMKEAERLAVKEGYRGIYTVAQDDNLSACLFYLGVGFEIGGLDTMVYDGTSQEGKSDIIFYKTLKK